MLASGGSPAHSTATAVEAAHAQYRAEQQRDSGCYSSSESLGALDAAMNTMMKYGGTRSATSFSQLGVPNGPVLSENEFPTLGAQGNIGGALQGAAGGNYANYANLMKSTDPTGPGAGFHHPSAGAGAQSQVEFHIANEDFPALPGANAQGVLHANGHADLSSMGKDASIGFQRQGHSGGYGSQMGGADNQQHRHGIQTDIRTGRVRGIPPGMLNDQFGMAGLLTFLRAIETDPSIVALALGHDLTTLGLNLNAPEKNLYQSFGGPWLDQPCRLHDVEAPVPPEYLTNAAIHKRLPPIRLNRYTDDVLFYMFYNFTGEAYQVAAASELYARDWRYHMDERVWITRAQIPDNPLLEQTAAYEHGLYTVFDPISWTKVPKEMRLEYTKLEGQPQLPQSLTQHTAAAAAQQQHQQQQVHVGSSSQPGGQVVSSQPQRSSQAKLDAQTGAQTSASQQNSALEQQLRPAAPAMS